MLNANHQFIHTTTKKSAIENIENVESADIQIKGT